MMLQYNISMQTVAKIVFINANEQLKARVPTVSIVALIHLDIRQRVARFTCHSTVRHYNEPFPLPVHFSLHSPIPAPI
jgi:hypothetical protein